MRFYKAFYSNKNCILRNYSFSWPNFRVNYEDQHLAVWKIQCSSRVIVILICYLFMMHRLVQASITYLSERDSLCSDFITVTMQELSLSHIQEVCMHFLWLFTQLWFPSLLIQILLNSRFFTNLSVIWLVIKRRLLRLNCLLVGYGVSVLVLIVPTICETWTEMSCVIFCNVAAISLFVAATWC